MDADVAALIADFTPQVPGQQPTGVLPWAIDPDLAEQLWHLSEKMTGVKFGGSPRASSSGRLAGSKMRFSTMSEDSKEDLWQRQQLHQQP
jgi:hypothetical protein